MLSNRVVRVVAGIALLIAIALLSLWREDEQGTAVERSEVSPRPSAQIDEDASRSAAGADFDYYVLVLSWSPTHCSSDRGRGRDDDLQCRSGRPFGFVLHGLWPQYERGYPADCPSEEPRSVAADIVADMLRISPSKDLVQHEWAKHGTCSGLGQRDYFATAERAFESISVPREFVELRAALATTPDAVRDAFLESNPALGRDSVSATCSRNELSELWVCLDKALRTRACSHDVARRHCGAREVRMRAVRGNWPR